jgi:uncharacterized RmlC-like cupin family protein
MTHRFLLLLAIASSAAAFGQTPPPAIQRVPQFENASVTCWKSVIPAGAQSTLHRHDHGRTVVGVTGGELKTVTADGRATVHRFEAGKAYWLDADPPGQMHRDVNDTSRPIEVIVVEMK